MMKSFLLLISLCLLNNTMQGQPGCSALWLKHTCGYTDGVNLLGGDVWGDAVCSDHLGHSYNAGPFMGYWFTMDTVIEMNTNRFYINKYNPNGQRMWTAKAKGTTSNSIMTCSKMLCDSIGNLYLCGTFSVDDSVYLAPFWYPVGGGYIAKYDSNGNNLWCRYISKSGSAGVYFTDMSIANGNLYACGIGNFGTIIFGTDTFNTNFSQNGFITKLNLNGTILHSELLDPNSSNELYGIAASPYTNQVYLVGQQLGQGSNNITVDGLTLPLVNGATNSMVIKMNSSLIAQWIKGGVTYLNPNATWGSGTKSLHRIGLDQSDNIYAVANGNGDSTRFGSLYFQHDVNGGYMQDVYIIKLNSSSDEQWLRFGKSKENDIVRDIAVDKFGNSILSVISGSNALGSFVFGSDSLPQHYGGLVKYDPFGNVIYAKPLQYAKSLKSLALGLDSSYYGTGQGFNPGQSYLNLAPTQCEDTVNGYYNAPYNMVMVKFFDNTTSIVTNTTAIQPNPEKLSIYPNPASEMIQIQSSSSSVYNFLISDISGKRILMGTTSIKQPIVLTSIRSGLYFITLQNSLTNYTQTFKFSKYD